MGTRGVGAGLRKELQEDVSYPEVINFPSETEHPSPNRSSQNNSARKAGWIVGGVILILLIAGAVTIASKLGEKKALAAETERLATPSVSVIHPTQEQSHEELVLPATVQAYKESPIYARTNGYVLRRSEERRVGKECRSG